MRKVLLSAASLAVSGLMFHGAFACELNREAGRPPSVIVLPGACGASSCLDNPQVSLTAVDPARDCGAIYFDPGIYSGNDGLVAWLVASVRTQDQYRPGGGFGPSPMDANARYR